MGINLASYSTPEAAIDGALPGPTPASAALILPTLSRDLRPTQRGDRGGRHAETRRSFSVGGRAIWSCCGGREGGSGLRQTSSITCANDARPHDNGPRVTGRDADPPLPARTTLPHEARGAKGRTQRQGRCPASGGRLRCVP